MANVEQKCFHCGSPMGKLSPSRGSSFALTEYDQDNNQMLVTSGVQVDVIGCPSCGLSVLNIPSLREK